MRTRILGTIGVCLGFVLAGPSAAQLAAAELAPGGFYLDLAGNAQYKDLPKTKGLVQTLFIDWEEDLEGGDPLPVTGSLDGESGGWGGGLAGGVSWVLPEGQQWLGRNLRVEASGHWFDLESDGGGQSP